MRTRNVTQCIICGKPVEQEKSTSVDRMTCARIKINGVWIKSECEKEKARRYQKTYREGNETRGRPKAILDRSVALSSIKHLAKHKASKYKRRCLKCLEKFIGIGRYNRVCDSCTVENSRQAHTYTGV
jgi:hypothetical protein